MNEYESGNCKKCQDRRGDAEDLCPGRGKNERRDQGSGGLSGAEPENVRGGIY